MHAQVLQTPLLACTKTVSSFPCCSKGLFPEDHPNFIGLWWSE